jgi:hypothetical protein
MNNNRVSRRDFLRLLKIMSIQAAAFGLLGYGYGTKMELNWIEITNLTLIPPRIRLPGMRPSRSATFIWVNGSTNDRMPGSDGWSKARPLILMALPEFNLQQTK